MIYRQISNYNCITLINIHRFSSLLPFPFFSLVLLLGLVGPKCHFTIPKNTVGVATVTSYWEQGRRGGLGTLLPGECCFWGALHPPLPSLNAQFATYLLPGLFASLAMEQ